MKSLIIVQAITQHMNPDRFPVIETLGVFDSITKAHQCAIDRCYDYTRENQMVWDAPQFDQCWQQGSTNSNGDSWQQIAPMGYEYTHGDRRWWIRLELINA